MIIKTNCRSEDWAWSIASFSSKSNRDRFGESSIFSSNLYYSENNSGFLRSEKNHFGACRCRSIKTEWESLGAKIRYLESETV